MRVGLDKELLIVKIKALSLIANIFSHDVVTLFVHELYSYFFSDGLMSLINMRDPWHDNAAVIADRR